MVVVCIRKPEIESEFFESIGKFDVGKEYYARLCGHTATVVKNNDSRDIYFGVGESFNCYFMLLKEYRKLKLEKLNEVCLY